MTLPIINVDLAEPPSVRWLGLAPYGAAIRELAQFYVRGLGELAGHRELLQVYRDGYIDEPCRQEIDAVAALSGVDPLDMVLVNAYYDAIKHSMACTAFAVDTPAGPLHARNLDWWSERSALSRHSVRVRYHEAGQLRFESVGWPGYIGTLSGMAPGRFSVTLNAVLGSDPPGLGRPISLILRDLLCHATYAEAVEALQHCELACDCLLLVVGVGKGEMCVVERTPSRCEVRGTDSGAIVVTNDYRALDRASSGGGTILQQTSCSRHDCASDRAHSEWPQDVQSCYDILDDERVKMDMTVQQMVMSASRGSLDARRGR